MTKLALELETGTQIRVDKTKRDCHFLHISGTREQVKNAEKKVEKYLTHLVTIDMMVLMGTAKELKNNLRRTLKRLKSLTGA